MRAAQGTVLAVYLNDDLFFFAMMLLCGGNKRRLNRLKYDFLVDVLIAMNRINNA
jgi:hypothetical protein